MAKKKRTVLPRVTVLAFNRRELAAFAQAVEKLGLLVEDLRLILASSPRRSPRPRAAVSVTENRSAETMKV